MNTNESDLVTWSAFLLLLIDVMEMAIKKKKLVANLLFNIYFIIIGIYCLESTWHDTTFSFAIPKPRGSADTDNVFFESY